MYNLFKRVFIFISSRNNKEYITSRTPLPSWNVPGSLNYPQTAASRQFLFIKAFEFIQNMRQFLTNFQSKNLYCRCMKLIQKSNFWVQGMFFQKLYWEKSKPDTLWRRLFWIHIYYLALIPPCICNHIHYKNLQFNFPTMRGGSPGRYGHF